MKRKVILLVVNQHRYYEELASNLQSFGYETRECADSQTVIQLLGQQVPAAILAELHLKELNGIELCWLIRETSTQRGVPFILLMESDDPEVRINGLRSGVDAFLTKNVSKRELVTYIEAIIKRLEPVQSQTTLCTSSLQGQTPAFSILEILQLLNMTHKSGTLAVTTPQQVGKIGISQGNLTGAQIAEQAGETAVLEMATWENARFEFQNEVLDTPNNIQRPTMEIILQCCTLLDEKQSNLKTT
ncbi:DUF4388 domain-containing protein [candidate division KSB1 bacterium]|nr:DUF4388 domain-containing protein [candidate division KSB1 bacterium]